jgi:hypothetical protein
MEYQRIELDAAITRTDEEIAFDKEYSNFMFLVNDVKVGFRINSEQCDELFTEEIDGFENNVGRFRKLYISHLPGTQGSKIVILAYR